MNSLSIEQLIKYAEEKVTNLSKVIDQSAFTNIKDRLIEELQLAQIGLDAIRELKAKQVPVGWEVCSPEWCNRHHACHEAPRIWFASEDGTGPHYHPSEYTAPQKPVVCLKSGYLHKSEVIDAIEAAGCVVSFSDERLMQDMSGIVKDGE